MSEFSLCLRILAAAAFGIAIGLEREYANKPAGLRTHVIVCVAAALLTTTALLLGERLNAHGDTMRVAAGVVTGIGFIGAGTIIQTRRTVIGLTTAATIFMAAAIGIAVGGGLYYLALTAAGLTVFATWVLRVFDPSLGESGNHRAGNPRRVRADSPSGTRKDARS
jgi:putative Mg2+ transporter-C (MgtC) family protein